MARRSAERTTYLADVMTTAIEGGINYWASLDTVSTVEDPTEILGWRYDAAYVVDLEDGEEYSISLDTIARGLNRISKIRPDGHIASAHRAMDAGDLDAIDADIIVQYGLFGELVYA